MQLSASYHCLIKPVKAFTKDCSQFWIFVFKDDLPREGNTARMHGVKLITASNDIMCAFTTTSCSNVLRSYCGIQRVVAYLL